MNLLEVATVLDHADTEGMDTPPAPNAWTIVEQGDGARWQSKWALYTVTHADGFTFDAGYGLSLTWAIANRWNAVTGAQRATVTHIFDHVRTAINSGVAEQQATWWGCWGVLTQREPGNHSFEFSKARVAQRREHRGRAPERHMDHPRRP